jgi:glycerophosphoryl diester phosphodiesterase
MIILSHRGYWQEEQEKNTERAFIRSFELGFGTETDIRDQNGELVISHDPPEESCLKFEDFLKIYCNYDKSLYLALNIKADGLQAKLKDLLNKYSIENYFVFDMSVPDGLSYLKSEMNVFTRQSEYEKDPAFYEEAQGIWLDCFDNDWIDEKTVSEHLTNRKKVCIVSPELHKRKYNSVWNKYKNFKCNNNSNIMICTDKPEDLKLFLE